jgi:pimeloyl-ACP methyl ester carboxylesterase
MTNNQRLSYLISKIALLLALILLAPAGATAQVWTVVAFDPKGDARDPSLADAAQLSYRYDKRQDFLWFRVSLYGIPNERAFGVNIVFDTGGDEAAKMNWWGANKAFRFDKLVTAWVTRDDSGYRGTVGVGDVAGISAKQVNNLLQNNLQIRVEGDSIVIGVKRTDVTDKLKMNLVAAVGSNQQWNDDVPGSASVAIDLSAERPKLGRREVDLSRNNFEFSADYKTLPDNKPPLITKEGRGRQTLILIPGMYSGATSFDGFIARNQSRYKFYVVTPPGINGRSARSMPAQGSSFGELAWTRRLERDILNLISREKMSWPVIIAGGNPASQAAVELAIEHPDKIGGVVLAGNNLVQFFPSPKDPTRKRPVTLEERAVLVDEGWGAKWFKYVTPETWNSNDMRPEMLSGDVSRGQKAWQEIEAAPLQVKIRYLCEFWASDITRGFDRLQVPVLALIPGFDEKFLADPANSFAKTSIVDSWETLIPKHPKLQLVKIPDARLLVLEDQPKLADDAIAKFVEQAGKIQKGR